MHRRIVTTEDLDGVVIKHVKRWYFSSIIISIVDFKRNLFLINQEIMDIHFTYGVMELNALSRLSTLRRYGQLFHTLSNRSENALEAQMYSKQESLIHPNWLHRMSYDYAIL